MLITRVGDWSNNVYIDTGDDPNVIVDHGVQVQNFTAVMEFAPGDPDAKIMLSWNVLADEDFNGYRIRYFDAPFAAPPGFLELPQMEIDGLENNTLSLLVDGVNFVYNNVYGFAIQPVYRQ